MSDASDQLSFLGTGWAFPPEFGPGGGDVAMVSELQDVHQALLLLFSTRPGERPMLDAFGCDLDAVMFDEIDQSLRNRVTAFISESILRYEPRVRLLDVQVEENPLEQGELAVRVSYEARGISTRHDVTFPLQLRDPTTP